MGVEGKRDNADLDDLVLAMIEARGFGVENDADERKLRPWLRHDGTRLKLLQHAVAARRLEMIDHRPGAHAGSRARRCALGACSLFVRIGRNKHVVLQCHQPFSRNFW
ncbi:hypothetical protein D9M72_632750 [compost metagenome]